jgi:hypothetical protein
LRALLGTETDKVVPALIAAILLRAKGHEEIREQPGIIVLARPGAEVSAQAAGALCVWKTRPEHDADEKAMVAIAAAERINA